MPFVLERSDGHRVAVVHEKLQRTRLSYELFNEALKRAPAAAFVPSKPLRITVDMGKVVGRAAIIKAAQIQPNQPALFARRRYAGHDRPSRVVEIDGMLPQTRYVTIIGDWVKQDEHWMIRTAYCGQYVYPQPWDFSAIVRSGLSLSNVLAFWCRAAFLYNPKEFQPRTHEDTWAGLVDDAAKRMSPDLVRMVGYNEVRRQWTSQ